MPWGNQVDENFPVPRPDIRLVGELFLNRIQDDSLVPNREGFQVVPDSHREFDAVHAYILAYAILKSRPFPE